MLPIPQDLALETERDKRMPRADDSILLNPETHEPLTRPRLYHRMIALGKRAGVPNADAQGFRDAFAVDMLARGATPYDVAKLLGDTADTLEKHYAPFVKERRDRVLRLMENGEGVEKKNCTIIAQEPAGKGRIQ